MSNSSPQELKGKILAKLKGPTLCALATVTEDGKPWVRYVMLYTDENLTMWGATFASFRKVAQIRKNPEVHISMGAKDMETAESFLQIQARAEIVTDAANQKGHVVRLPQEYLHRPRRPQLRRNQGYPVPYRIRQNGPHPGRGVGGVRQRDSPEGGLSRPPSGARITRGDATWGALLSCNVLRILDTGVRRYDGRRKIQTVKRE